MVMLQSEIQLGDCLTIARKVADALALVLQVIPKTCPTSG